MRFAMIKEQERETACFVTSRGLMKIETFNEIKRTEWGTDIETLIAKDHIPQLVRWYRAGGRDVIDIMIKSIIPFDKVIYAPLFKKAPKVLAEESESKVPETSDSQSRITLLGCGDEINLAESEAKVTCRAALGAVMGKSSSELRGENFLSCAAAFTSVLEAAQEDRTNASERHFEKFFSMGPQLITSDEISDISALSVQIVRNGTVAGENGAEAAAPSPSDAAAWNKGDIILTYGGRAAELKAKDIVECRITGFPSLINKISAN